MTGIGGQWELDFAQKFGAKVQPGSGNKPHAKLDVAGKNILWSLKATQGESFRLSPEEIEEAITGARGLGGPGVIPGMAIRVGDYDVVVMLAGDLIDVLTQPEAHSIPERKSDRRRREAAIPGILREANDNDANSSSSTDGDDG